MQKSILKVLMADDNQDDVTLFRMALDKADVPVKLQTVSDGAEAIAYLEGRNGFSDRLTHPLPDLILLDLNMPLKNGFEVLEWMRQQDKYKDAVIHVFSASCREVDVRRCYDLRANSYVVKPSRMNDLISFVSGLFRWHQFICLPSDISKRV